MNFCFIIYIHIRYIIIDNGGKAESEGIIDEEMKILSYLHHTMYSLEVRYSRSSSLLLVSVVEARDLATSSDTHVEVRVSHFTNRSEVIFI